MKKHVLLTTMILTLGIAAGCGAKDNNAVPTGSSVAVEESSVEAAVTEQTTQADTTEDAASEQQGTVTGTIDEVNDMYFSIEDENGTFYQFAYDEESTVDFSTLAVGDTIIITYEGALSDVDTFYGKIINIEKSQK